MEIKSISQRIFKPASQKSEQNSCQTNPFGVNFKGNMITADVFEKPEKSEVAFSGLKEIMTRKMTMSAVLAPMSEAISKRLNSVMSFGRKIGENATNLWKQANNIEINLNLPTFTNVRNAIRERVLEMNTYSINNLQKLETGDLGRMFEELVTA